MLFREFFCVKVFSFLFSARLLIDRRTTYTVERGYAERPECNPLKTDEMKSVENSGDEIIIKTTSSRAQTRLERRCSACE